MAASVAVRAAALMLMMRRQMRPATRALRECIRIVIMCVVA